MPSITRLVEQYKNANVTITSDLKKFGSGFIFSYDGVLMIMTSASLVFMNDTRNPADNIICGIYNVNGKGVNLTYNLEIVGVDGLADVAILKIKDDKEPPKYNLHPSYGFGNNLDEKAGSTVINISGSSQDVVCGIIRDEKYNHPQIRSTCILTNCLLNSSSRGSAIFNCKGRVLGLMSFGWDEDIGFSGGTGSNTLNIIVSNILGNQNVEELTVGDKTYLSNLKGWLSTFRNDTLVNLPYEMVTLEVLNTKYPENKNLEIKGMSLNAILVFSELDKDDIILAISFPDGTFMEIGTGDNQYPPGTALWDYGPENNKAKLKVIKNPKENSIVTEINYVLDQVPAPEYLPFSGGNSNKTTY